MKKDHWNFCIGRIYSDKQGSFSPGDSGTDEKEIKPRMKIQIILNQQIF